MVKLPAGASSSTARSGTVGSIVVTVALLAGTSGWSARMRKVPTPLAVTLSTAIRALAGGGSSALMNSHVTVDARGEGHDPDRIRLVRRGTRG